MDIMLDILFKIVMYGTLVSVSGFIIKKMFKKSDKTKSQEKSQINIIRPVNMASMLLPFAALFIILPFFVMIINKIYPPDYNNTQKVAGVIGIIFFFGGAFYLLCFSLYGMLWEVRIEGDKIIHRTIFGRTKIYYFSDITKCVSNNYDELRVYVKKKKIFVINSSMDGSLFQEKIREKNIPVEDLKGMSVDNHIIRPLHILWILPALGAAFMCWLFALCAKQNVSVGALFGLLITIGAFLGCTFTYFFDKTKIDGKKIYQSAFLKRKKELDFSQITHIQEEKNKGGTEFFGLYNKKERVLRIRKHNHGMILFEAKISREGIKWRNIRKQ